MRADEAEAIIIFAARVCHASFLLRCRGYSARAFLVISESYFSMRCMYISNFRLTSALRFERVFVFLFSLYI